LSGVFKREFCREDNTGVGEIDSLDSRWIIPHNILLLHDTRWVFGVCSIVLVYLCLEIVDLKIVFAFTVCSIILYVCIIL
jgi:hypothetical protein